MDQEYLNHLRKRAGFPENRYPHLGELGAILSKYQTQGEGSVNSQEIRIYFDLTKSSALFIKLNRKGSLIRFFLGEDIPLYEYLAEVSVCTREPLKTPTKILLGATDTHKEYRPNRLRNDDLQKDLELALQELDQILQEIMEPSND